MKFAAASLLAVAASTAQSAVVQQQYTAYVTGVSSSSEVVSIGSQPVQTLDRLTGTFSFDSAMVGETPPLFSPLQYEYGYRGAVQSNYISASLNGLLVAAPPTSSTSSCSALDPLCATPPIVMKRSAGPTILDHATDVLSLSYSIPSNNPFFVPNAPARVSLVTMDFFYPSELPGSALPGQINLSDLRLAQMMLTLSDGAVVYARVDSISAPAVPEPETWALMLAGMGLLAAVARRQRRA